MMGGRKMFVVIRKDCLLALCPTDEGASDIQDEMLGQGAKLRVDIFL